MTTSSGNSDASVWQAPHLPAAGNPPTRIVAPGKRLVTLGEENGLLYTLSILSPWSPALGPNDPWRGLTRTLARALGLPITRPAEIVSRQFELASIWHVDYDPRRQLHVYCVAWRPILTEPNGIVAGPPQSAINAAARAFNPELLADIGSLLPIEGDREPQMEWDRRISLHPTQWFGPRRMVGVVIGSLSNHRPPLPAPVIFGLGPDATVRGTCGLIQQAFAGSGDDRGDTLPIELRDVMSGADVVLRSFHVITRPQVETVTGGNAPDPRADPIVAKMDTSRFARLAVGEVGPSDKRVSANPDQARLMARITGFLCGSPVELGPAGSRTELRYSVSAAISPWGTNVAG